MSAENVPKRPRTIIYVSCLHLTITVTCEIHIFCLSSAPSTLYFVHPLVVDYFFTIFFLSCSWEKQLSNFFCSTQAISFTKYTYNAVLASASNEKSQLVCRFTVPPIFIQFVNIIEFSPLLLFSLYFILFSFPSLLLF